MITADKALVGILVGLFIIAATLIFTTSYDLDICGVDIQYNGTYALVNYTYDPDIGLQKYTFEQREEESV